MKWRYPMRARRVTITAVSIAIVVVMVYIIRIPVPATGGYWHTGVVAEIFIAMAFGPTIGGIAAGVGAAIADLIAGYASFAPLTLIAHGATGILAGLIGWKKGWGGMLAGWVVGGLAQVAIYFLGEATLYGFGIVGAGAEVVGNLVQVGLGGFGLLLFQQVRRAYPQIVGLATEAVFEDEGISSK
jgi:uncharacterized membrane protein